MNREELTAVLIRSFGETAYMVAWSLVIAVAAGGVIGLVLYLSASPHFLKNRAVNQAAGILVNVIRSVPFVILMVALLPFGKLIVGTSIGPKSVVFPLAVSATAFYARLAENAFQEVDRGVVEAAISSGAGPWQVITGILLPEAWPQLIRHVTVTTISLVGFSAMAGIVGGGGVGDLAIRYGYQRYQVDVMVICVAVLVLLVQVIQLAGDKIASSYTK